VIQYAGIEHPRPTPENENEARDAAWPPKRLQSYELVSIRMTEVMFNWYLSAVDIADEPDKFIVAFWNKVPDQLNLGGPYDEFVDEIMQ
jgi:hypothetical protein